MNLSDYLNESGIVLDIPGDSKEIILANLVETLAQLVPVNKNSIVRLLEEREKLSTTGIGFEIVTKEGILRSEKALSVADSVEQADALLAVSNSDLNN